MHFARKVLNAPKTLLRTCAFFDFRRGSKKRIHLQLLPMFCECLSFFEKPFVYNHCHCDSFVSLKLIFCHGGGQQHTVSVDQKQDNVAAYRKTMLMQKKKKRNCCATETQSAHPALSAQKTSTTITSIKLKCTRRTGRANGPLQNRSFICKHSNSQSSGNSTCCVRVCGIKIPRLYFRSILPHYYQLKPRHCRCSLDRLNSICIRYFPKLKLHIPTTKFNSSQIGKFLNAQNEKTREPNKRTQLR